MRIFDISAMAIVFAVVVLFMLMVGCDSPPPPAKGECPVVAVLTYWDCNGSTDADGVPVGICYPTLSCSDPARAAFNDCLSVDMDAGNLHCLAECP